MCEGSWGIEQESEGVNRHEKRQWQDVAQVIHKPPCLHSIAFCEKSMLTQLIRSVELLPILSDASLLLILMQYLRYTIVQYLRYTFCAVFEVYNCAVFEVYNQNNKED